MEFDFKKYDKRKFHEDEEVDKKIKALFLLFDYEVLRLKLSYPQQLTKIDDWIKKFEEHELYEVIPMFKLRRGVIVRQIIRQKHENMSFGEHMAPILTNNWNKIKNFFKKLFRRN